jgi:membrane-bound metal-dependent hydrolase YbcI (DUF457 family)
MFVGHYAAALAAKAAEPRAPLWTYVLGCQLIDVGWSGLIMTGAERVSFNPDLPGSSLVLEHMPYTHSLPASLLWALGAVILARLALRLPWRAAVFVGLAVFSHWVLDFLVHRPDLELWFGGPKVGLALWNYPVPEQALEIGLLAVAGGAWAWRRGTQGLSAWSAPVFLTLLVAVQVIAMLTPPAAVMRMGGTALAVYLVLTAAAMLIDSEKRRPL